MVHVDGGVTTCCLDEHLENRIGNLRETPLSELWYGPKMERWRQAHVEGRFEASGPLCTRCNWQSAGEAPQSQVEAWFQRRGDTAGLARYRARRTKE